MGRYDALLEPKGQEDYAIIMEFKGQTPKEEKSLEEMAAKARWGEMYKEV